MPRIKGTLLLARLKYLKGFGPETVDAVLARLREDEAHQLRSMILPSSWYPSALLRRLEESIVAVLNHGSRGALFLEIGREAAAANLTGKGLQRVFVREGEPHFVLMHAPSIYASYFTDGRRTYERTGEQSAIVRTVKPFADAHPEECLITVGWLTRAIEISGGEDVRVHETTCGTSGAPHCEFHCRWRARRASAATG